MVKTKPKTSRAAKPYEAQGHDLCQTPYYAVEPLIPYLPTDKIIWEPCAGEGYLAQALEAANKIVVKTDLQTGYNFFEHQPYIWNISVQNPPYSVKYLWLKRLYELGKPFAALVPIDVFGAASAQKYLNEYGFEAMYFDKRIDFRMPNKGWDSSAQFATMWLCRGILPEQVMFVKINKPTKENKIKDDESYEANFNAYTKRIQALLSV